MRKKERLRCTISAEKLINHENYHFSAFKMLKRGKRAFKAFTNI